MFKTLYCANLLKIPLYLEAKMSKKKPIKSKVELNVEEVKAKLLVKYCLFVTRRSYHPSASDLVTMGLNRDRVRNYFGSHKRLREEARLSNPKVFKDIVDETLFTPKAYKKLEQDVAKHTRYVLSTAVTGCDVHEGFFNAIKSYNKRKKSITLVLPSTDTAASVPFHLDPALAQSSLLVDDLALNDNIFVSSIRLGAKHIDPITGLSRIGQRNGSFVYASPKQRLKFTPTSNVKIPHALMTTGALTKPNYSTERYMSKRTAYIADNDHVIGAIIVEVEDDQIFHFRQVQADKSGNFVDLGVMYMADGSTKPVRPEALVLGDWHSGETDYAAMRAFVTGKDSVLNTTKPKRLVIHDGFNGRSISHHEVKNKILRAQRAKQNHLSLGAELEEYAKDLEMMASYPFIEEIVISQSNHDEFLNRYLAEGRYIEDAQNHEIALQLASAMLTGTNPIKAFMEKRGIKNGKKIRWLSRDEDYKIAHIELGAHGDLGANGARGSLYAMEHAYGNSVSGHAHTPEVLRGAWQVGTCSLLKLNYNRGPSSWLHSSCLVYPNGSRQLINIIDGMWKVD